MDVLDDVMGVSTAVSVVFGNIDLERVVNRRNAEACGVVASAHMLSVVSFIVNETFLLAVLGPSLMCLFVIGW